MSGLTIIFELTAKFREISISLNYFAKFHEISWNFYFAKFREISRNLKKFDEISSGIFDVEVLLYNFRLITSDLIFFFNFYTKLASLSLFPNSRLVVQINFFFEKFAKIKNYQFLMLELSTFWKFSKFPRIFREFGRSNYANSYDELANLV